MRVSEVYANCIIDTGHRQSAVRGARVSLVISISYRADHIQVIAITGPRATAVFGFHVEKELPDELLRSASIRVLYMRTDIAEE